MPLRRRIVRGVGVLVGVEAVAVTKEAVTEVVEAEIKLVVIVESPARQLDRQSKVAVPRPSPFSLADSTGSGVRENRGT